MEVKNLNFMSDLLIEHWKLQGIPIIRSDLVKDNPLLPMDFIEFYEKVNGMKSLYPNYTDNEGFLFYPIESIIAVEEEMEGYGTTNDAIYLFAEYMHKSWWYGFKLEENGFYKIGIIPYENRFKTIANDLATFIHLYIEDSPILYDYS